MRAHDLRGAGDTTRAGQVLDHHGLAQRLGQAVADGAVGAIRPRARRQRQDDAQGPGSPRLWARTRPTGASAAAPKAAAPQHRARGRTGDPARKMLRCRQHRGAQSLWAGRWVSSWSCLRCCCESGAGRALSVRRTGPLRLPVVPLRPRRPLAAGPAPARACSPALASSPPCAGPAPGAAGARPGAGRSWPGAAAWCGRFGRRARHQAR